MSTINLLTKEKSMKKPSILGTVIAIMTMTLLVSALAKEKSGGTSGADYYNCDRDGQTCICCPSGYELTCFGESSAGGWPMGCCPKGHSYFIRHYPEPGKTLQYCFDSSAKADNYCDAAGKDCYIAHCRQGHFCQD